MTQKPSVFKYNRGRWFFWRNTVELFDLKIANEGLVLVAGRPGIGKSYAMIEMANLLIKSGAKAVLVYADGATSHDIVHYENGEVRTLLSKLSRVNRVYPEIPYVVEDGGEWFMPYSWDKFLNDYIDHEKPQALFINSIVIPRENASAELLQTIQRIAKEKHILIFAEINVTRAVERRKNKRPKPKDVKCVWSARKFVDQYVFVYRDVYYMEDGKEKSESIEVYTSNGEKTLIAFEPKKYSI